MIRGLRRWGPPSAPCLRRGRLRHLPPQSRGESCSEVAEWRWIGGWAMLGGPNRCLGEDAR